MVRPKIAQRLLWCGHVAASTDEEITGDKTQGVRGIGVNRSMSLKIGQTSDQD